jgi:hypothetical protein
MTEMNITVTRLIPMRIVRSRVPAGIDPFDVATLVHERQGRRKPGAEAPEEESVATVRG